MSCATFVVFLRKYIPGFVKVLWYYRLGTLALVF
jgi:hypothetical protein